MKIGRNSIKQAEMACDHFKLNKKSVSVISRIVRLSKFHATLCEHACNRGLSVSEVKRKNNIEGVICALVSLVGLHVRFDGDPRGYTVKLFNEKPTDQMIGFGVGKQ